MATAKFKTEKEQSLALALMGNKTQAIKEKNFLNMIVKTSKNVKKQKTDKALTNLFLNIKKEH